MIKQMLFKKKKNVTCLRWPLGRYFKKEKTYLPTKKICSKRFSKLTL